MKECFNTRKGPAAVGPYSTCVTVGDTVYVSGTIPLVPATGALAEGGIEGQTVQVLNNLQAILEELGLTMNSVVKTTVYLTNLDDFGRVNALYDGYFAPNYPARVCCEVSRLPKGAQIEIEAIAVRNAE